MRNCAQGNVLLQMEGNVGKIYKAQHTVTVTSLIKRHSGLIDGLSDSSPNPFANPSVFC